MKKMNMIIPAIFTSELIYCIHVTGTIWGLTEYGEDELMKISCPKAIIQKLQSCQRMAVSLLFPDLWVNWETRTSTLLKSSNTMSVHQLIAANIIRIALNAIKFRKPKFLHDLLTKKPTRGRNKDSIPIPRCRLNITTEIFHNQAARLLNMLPPSIIEEQSLLKRKKLIKIWVTTHINTHPCR